jgi:hypothetical protein
VRLHLRPAEAPVTGFGALILNRGGRIAVY